MKLSCLLCVVVAFTFAAHACVYLLFATFDMCIS